MVEEYADAIRSGRLTSGSRLPTHRALAAREGIAVVTATRVYAELEALGLVSREQGRGTFVRDAAVPPGHGVDQVDVAAGTVDLTFNHPALPGQADLLRQALRELSTAGDLDALLRYQPHEGRPAERATVARHLLRHGVDVAPDRVVLTSGAQHGLAVTVMATLRPGDVVAVDALTYPGFKVLAPAFGLDLAPLPVTPDGPDLDELDRLCATRPVRAVYAMPTVHNPLGWVVGEAHRRRLVAAARRHDLLLVEDASYAYLGGSGATPLAALAPERTVHVTALSKNVATGLRVGFLAAPGDLVPALARAVRATTWNTPALLTALACRWIEDGTVARLEEEKRADARTRQALARAALDDLGAVAHPTSYVTWLPLPPDGRADRVAGALGRAGVSVSTAEPFATTSAVPQAIRLALGSVDLETLRDSLAVVRRAVLDDAAS
nr:PLP-dependent aminotransferase family protein [Nocardioides flavescens]